MCFGWCIFPIFALAGCASQPVIAPNGVVSNNPCIDAVLAEIALPGQVTAISSYSHDPDSASSARPVESKSKPPNAMKGRAVQTSVINRSVNAPISQFMISLAANGFGAMLMTKAVSAPASVESTMPPRMKPIGPPPRDIARSNAMLAPAPSIAAIISSPFHRLAFNPKISIR